jgi:hypothetical protein
MTDTTFTELEQLHQSQGSAAVLDRLIETLRTGKKYHQLFDASLLRKKLEMGLPVAKPTSFDDVPEARRDEFERHYVDQARAVGELFLADGAIRDAWVYLRTIRETQKVAAAIEALPKSRTPEEEIIDIALYQGAHPAKGIELMLASHGTCSTITAFDQISPQLALDVRQKCAALLVRELYNSLAENVQHDVQRRIATLPPGQSLHELIAGREWLFEEGNYHIDVSHLNAVVRFARSLDSAQPELKLALQLSEYGSKLSSQYQYAGHAPFQEFYPASLQFFKALLGENRDEALGYFRDKLTPDPADYDNQLTALTLVDLLTRADRPGEAVDVACKYLANAPDEFGFSLADLCAKAGRWSDWQRVCRDKGDLVGFTAALVQSK